MAIHNKPFIDAFNEAIKKLEGDKLGVVTFDLAVYQVYEMFGKANGMTGGELMNRSSHVHMDNERMERLKGERVKP